MRALRSFVPQFLCHYYDSANGPFRNLSDLPFHEAEQVLDSIRRTGSGFASRRNSDYLIIRRQLEHQIREIFVAKGGRPRRSSPHYMIVGSCPWVRSWYSDPRELCIPLTRFSPHTVSFTYGDSFPAMRFQDGKPYRKQVYTVDELETLVELYGLPQDWNCAGDKGPDRYIEAQIWGDELLQNYLTSG